MVIVDGAVGGHVERAAVVDEDSLGGKRAAQIVGSGDAVVSQSGHAAERQRTAGLRNRSRRRAAQLQTRRTIIGQPDLRRAAVGHRDGVARAGHGAAAPVGGRPPVACRAGPIDRRGQTGSGLPRKRAE